MRPKRYHYYCLGAGVLWFLTQVLHFVLQQYQTEFGRVLHLYDSIQFMNNIQEEHTDDLHSYDIIQSMSKNTRFYGYYINATGDFLERINKFNTALSEIRNIVRNESSLSLSLKRKFRREDPWKALGVNTKFIWGARDDYMEELAAHRHIITVALPWMKRETVENEQWNSSTDKSNYLYQTYYQWTGSDQLCTWIETGMVNRFQYDVVLNRSCSRDIISGAVRPHVVQPLFFYNKLFIKNLYWPNNGTAYPTSFYTSPPSSVLHVHIHRNAVVDSKGDVFSGNTSLALYNCRNWSKPPTTLLPPNALKVRLSNEVFTIGQCWATSIYHRAIEAVPRLTPYIRFLNKNPQILIHAAEKEKSLLGEMMKVLGLNPSRLITGTQRARILYQPRETGCEMASVQEVQIAASIYRNYIARKLSPARFRNRLILVQRTKLRKFVEQNAIENALQMLAAEYNLKYTLFAEKRLPSLRDTMVLFNEAVMIVGPHGAGMLNMLFSEPGTFVVEGVCNIPHLNLCFQRLAHVLGHRYHGIASKEGCMERVDVSAEEVQQAAKTYLDLWKQMSSQRI